ncbi:M6 family metalloprotease domain-containing protein, partial [Streptomyces hainanensis]
MPHIPGRRAALAAGGSLALLLGSTPGTAVTPPTGTPAAGSTTVTDCAPEAHPSLAEGLTETIGAAPGFAPATGDVTALTVFVDFPDSEADISTRDRFDEFFPATADHFAASSYGRLAYRAVPLHHWLRMSQPFEDYGIDRGAGWRPDDDQGYNRLLHEIVDALEDDPDFTGFADYDLLNVLAAPDAGPPATEQVLS